MDLVKEIAARGHEVGHHGYMHEPPASMSAEEEEEILEKGMDILGSITGQPPRIECRLAQQLRRVTMSGIWPGDTQCVAMLTFDVDGVSSWLRRDPNFANLPSRFADGA